MLAILNAIGLRNVHFDFSFTAGMSSGANSVFGLKAFSMEITLLSCVDQWLQPTLRVELFYFPEEYDTT